MLKYPNCLGDNDPSALVVIPATALEVSELIADEERLARLPVGNKLTMLVGICMKIKMC